MLHRRGLSIGAAWRVFFWLVTDDRPFFFQVQRRPLRWFPDKRSGGLGQNPYLESAGLESKITRQRAADLIRAARFLGFKRVSRPLSVPVKPQ